MKSVKFESDYSPGTVLRIVQTDDGDIVLKIKGDGEMRIATSGGKLHGVQLVKCISGFSKVIDSMEPRAITEEKLVESLRHYYLYFSRCIECKCALKKQAAELASILEEAADVIEAHRVTMQELPDSKDGNMKGE